MRNLFQLALGAAVCISNVAFAGYGSSASNKSDDAIFEPRSKDDKSDAFHGIAGIGSIFMGTASIVAGVVHETPNLKVLNGALHRAQVADAYARNTFASEQDRLAAIRMIDDELLNYEKAGRAASPAGNQLLGRLEELRKSVIVPDAAVRAQMIATAKSELAEASQALAAYPGFINLWARRGLRVVGILGGGVLLADATSRFYVYSCLKGDPTLSPVATAGWYAAKKLYNFVESEK